MSVFTCYRPGIYPVGVKPYVMFLQAESLDEALDMLDTHLSESGSEYHSSDYEVDEAELQIRAMGLMPVDTCQWSAVTLEEMLAAVQDENYMTTHSDLYYRYRVGDYQVKFTDFFSGGPDQDDPTFPAGVYA